MEIIRSWLQEGILAPGMMIPPEREIAKALGTSQATVQRAFRELENQGTLERISSHKRIVSRNAVRFASIAAQTMAVCTSCSAQDAQRLSKTWESGRLFGVLSEMQDIGYNSFQFAPSSLNALKINQLCRASFSAFLFPEGCQPETLTLAEKLRAAGVPVVFFGDDPDLAGYDRITSDHAAGAEKIVRWLISRGRRRLVWVTLRQGAQSPWWLKDREAGIYRALTAERLELLQHLELPYFPPSAAHTHWPAEAHEFYIKYLMGSMVLLLQEKKPPDALILTTDGLLEAAAEVCGRLGFSIGQDMLLAGYDNYWQNNWTRGGKPVAPAVTVDKRNEETGREMVRLARDRLAGRLPSEAVCRKIEPELKVVPEENT
ncbi:MAG: LacI family transcriptional regulator [Planctomycetota bacterium]|nr:LacI family transcriptional regulator [Planctomycetota bacterium]